MYKEKLRHTSSQLLAQTRHHDERFAARAGGADPRHGHGQDGGDAAGDRGDGVLYCTVLYCSVGDRGDGGRPQRSQDRRHRGVLRGRVPLDGQHRLRHQEQPEGVSRQLAETISGKMSTKNIME